MIKKFFALIIIFSLSLNFFGCSQKAKKKSVKELYDEAYNLYAHKSYARAKTAFEDVIREDPLNKYAVMSELNLADILYIKEDFDSSIIHYEEYLRLDPKTVKHEFVLHRIGMGHFNLIRTPDRDQTESEKAISKFDEYLLKYADGEYKDEVIKKKEAAMENILISEFNVGMFYFNMEKYDSAAIRFENIIAKYKKSDLLEKTYFILAKTFGKLFKKDKLKDLHSDYLNNYPDGKFSGEINKLIQETT